MPTLHFDLPVVNLVDTPLRPFLPFRDLVITVARRFRVANVAWASLLMAGLVATGSSLVFGPLALARAENPPVAAHSAALARGRATGRIEGTVEVSSTLAPRRPQFRIYSEPGAGSAAGPAAPHDPLIAELHNVIVYLEGDSASELAADPRADSRRHGSIAQHDERFVPHVVAVMQGGTIDFPNDDDVYHNVFSLSSTASPGGKGFDLGRYPKGSSKSWTFTKPGTVQVFCHIHSDMSAIVLVLTNPFFTSPDDNHRFSIEGVPEGDYTIIGWHERIKPISRRIHVSAGQTTLIDFNIPLPQGGAVPRQP